MTDAEMAQRLNAKADSVVAHIVRRVRARRETIRQLRASAHRAEQNRDTFQRLIRKLTIPGVAE